MNAFGGLFLFGSLAVAAVASAQDDVDPRERYDVSAYRLDLWIDTEQAMVRGVATMEAVVIDDPLDELVVDAHSLLQVSAASWVQSPLDEPFLDEAEALAFEQQGHRVTVALPRVLDPGETLRVALAYRGRPLVQDEFTGFHFARTPSGQPWIASSCQTIGSHTWWPCKSSFFHPDDKPDRVALNVTVPAELTAAANGRLLEVVEEGPYRTFRWQHDEPLPTYAVAVAVAPYVELRDEYQLPGHDEPVPVQLFVLPEHVEAAKLEFEVLPELLRFYSERFGPYPFASSKIGLAETPFWGMEHSTLIAYGNSFPTWKALHGEPDPFEIRNRRFDYILVHEFAHEWWGNSVTARSWGDFWLHEGFATYAEALWVEHRYGLDEYLNFLQESKRGLAPSEPVFRPLHEDAGQAYTEVIYDKGAWILHMLRYVLRRPERTDPADRDREFFAALREFANDPAHRHGSASSRDFQRICERHHGERLTSFFQPWLYGAGWPHYTVERKPIEETSVTLVVHGRGSALFPFRMPLDVELVTTDGAVHPQRVMLEQGTHTIKLDAPTPIADVRFPGFRWILCDVTFVP